MPEVEKLVNRKPSEKQVQVMTALGATLQDPALRERGMSPSDVGVACGKAKGSPAADWAYPAIKTLLRKNLIEKTAAPGRYRLPVKP